MAITILKQPAQFFNCTNPAIFEFTTDAVVGNFDDYVCDVVITSLYSSKTAIIKNVFPNTKTKIFSVDASEFFKSLQLNGFEFNFEGSKNLSIEKFTTSLNIRDSSIPDADIFSYNNYYFDNFVFTEGTGAVDASDLDSYSILGERLLFDSFVNLIPANKLTFLAPTVIEVCEGFTNTVSIFLNELTGNTLSVNGLTGNITNVKGVSTYTITSPQVASIKSLRELTTSNQNTAKKISAIDFKRGCAKVVQFRFFNHLGGFSHFFAEIDADTDDRSKITFYDRSYNNENENKSPSVQSGGEYKRDISFKGNKIIILKELFTMLLRSPKIEMNLGEGIYIECEISGSSASRYTHFDYQMKATIKNTGNFKL
jgi:hypothetical protein